MTYFNETFNNNNTQFVSNGSVCVQLKIVGSFLAVLVVATIVINSTLIWTVFKNKKLHAPINYLNLFLSSVQLLCTLTDSVLFVASLFNCNVVYDKPGCNFVGFILVFTISVGSYTLMMCSIERYLAICQPIKGFLFNTKRCVISIVMIVVISFIISILPVFAWSEYTYDVGNVSCWISEDFFRRDALYHWILVAITLYFMPLATLSYTNARSILTIKKSTKKFANDRSTKGRLRKESRLLRITIYSIVAFMVSYTPYLISLFAGLFISGPNVSIIHTLSAVIARLSLFWPSFLNILINKNIRLYIFNTRRVFDANTERTI